MRTRKPSFAAPGLVLAFAIAAVTGCAPAAPSAAPQAPPARMERVGSSHSLSVVLTPLGATPSVFHHSTHAEAGVNDQRGDHDQ